MGKVIEVWESTNGNEALIDIVLVVSKAQFKRFMEHCERLHIKPTKAASVALKEWIKREDDNPSSTDLVKVEPSSNCDHNWVTTETGHKYSKIMCSRCGATDTLGS